MEKKFRETGKSPFHRSASGKAQAPQGGGDRYRKRSIRRAPSALDAHYRRARGDLRGLVELLQYQNPNNPGEAAQVRKTAAEVLPDLHDRRVVDGLIGALTDNSPLVQAAAAEGLGRLSAVIPVTGRATAASGLAVVDRARILEALFPLVRADSSERVDNEVRSAAAEALFQVGGQAVLRPLLTAARHASPAFQSWFVRWAVRVRQDELLIDLYPWAGPQVRELIIERLRRRLTQPVLKRLEGAERPSDDDLEELIRRVFG